MYRSRVNTSGFNFLAFNYHIRYVLKTEQKIAREKGKLSVHFDKWEPVNVIHAKTVRPYLGGGMGCLGGW